MSSSTSSSIGVIVCSSRKPRVCPQVTDFVIDSLKQGIPTLSHSSSITLEVIDLAAWNLPLFDEPFIPSQIPTHDGYAHAHTRAWSQEIQKYSAFVFVTPQYNWGYPAVLKNAIDFLFNEWVGKSAMIVTYGGHGGIKCAVQLREVLHGVRMTVAETMPALTFPSREAMAEAGRRGEMTLILEQRAWEPERVNICKAFEELMVLMSKTN